jgi:putative transposase
MSNHHHLVVTDPRGLLPDFLRDLHRLTAKAMNAAQGQWENLWAAEPCNVVRLVTDEDVEEKVAYVAANPVAAGLVRRPEEWPGVVLWANRALRVVRPTSYFRKDGTCAPELVLSVVPPPVRDGGKRSPNDWMHRLTRAVAAKVADAQRAVAGSGRAFLGRKAALTASFAQRARSHEERFGVVPSFAATARAVRDKLRQVERYFRRSYRAALKEWRSGQRSVVFPFGTWGIVVFHSAAVQALPPP